MVPPKASNRGEVGKDSGEEDLPTTLSNLKISVNPSNKAQLSKSKNKKVVAESWDDELSSCDDEDEAENQEVGQNSNTRETAISTDKSRDEESAPSPPTDLPTRISKNAPTSSRTNPISSDLPPYLPYTSLPPHTHPSSTTQPILPTKRPEKTTAVATRLIAGALGVRAPRRTAEEREYDRVEAEKARARRREEREAKEREERERGERRRAVWED